jgi:hypothetical protein
MSAAILLTFLIFLGDPSPPPGSITPYPTGVVLERLPGRPGFQASGEAARRYVKEAIAQTVYGDDPVPGASPPWLILIGPEAETSQIESQIPDDIRTLIRIARYTPDDTRLERGFKAHYPGGTYAILMDGSRAISWKGLAAIADILRQINRLLGREPEPSPWDIPIPLPFPPGGSAMSSFVSGVFLGAILGWLSVGVVWFTVSMVSWVRSIQSRLDALNSIDAAPKRMSSGTPESPAHTSHPNA